MFVFGQIVCARESLQTHIAGFVDFLLLCLWSTITFTVHAVRHTLAGILLAVYQAYVSLLVSSRDKAQQRLIAAASYSTESPAGL